MSYGMMMVTSQTFRSLLRVYETLGHVLFKLILIAHPF